jgi:RNA polymerase sigma-70 factor (ECF subfamily)
MQLLTSIGAVRVGERKPLGAMGPHAETMNTVNLGARYPFGAKNDDRAVTSNSNLPVANTQSKSVAEHDPDLVHVVAVLAGNKSAFENVIYAHETKVYNLALRMLYNEAEAQDATQDVFLQAYLRLSSFNSNYKFKTWLMSIASNLCIDRLRRRKIEPITFADKTDPQTDIDPIEQLESTEPSPHTIVEENEQRAMVINLLRSLQPSDRNLVVLHYWGDMSYEEIAQAAQLTVSGVKSRLFRARRCMAEVALAQKLEV